jgi:hypothetical protein
MTPLHIAAEDGGYQATTVLINAGANVNAVDGRGGTPLHRAAGGNHSLIAKVLLARGCDPDILDCLGYSAFHVALVMRKTHVVKLLAAWPEMDAVEIFELDEANAGEVGNDFRESVQKIAIQYHFDPVIQHVLAECCLNKKYVDRDLLGVLSLFYSDRSREFQHLQS